MTRAEGTGGFLAMLLLVVCIDQIRPPNKSQKEEKLAILITYAFTINQVPHLFGEHNFVGTNTNTWNYQKALFDADSRKEARETPTIPTQNGQNPMGQRPMTSPRPATQRRWPEVVVKGWPLLGGDRSPLDTALPLLAVAVACRHAEAVQPRVSRQT